ncbi:ABC-three component system protein, partial [Enterobacter roggenkampii]|uniref:ABC-three component system protein n=2 Tax=Enterobacter TaxID=547 RepID=UPI0021CF6710
NIVEHSDKEIKCDTNEDVEYGDIEGFSGGGIFYLTETNAFLIGIEHKLHQSGEYTNKIISIPVKCFNTIITKYNLQPIRPPYYGDFKELKTSIFNYTNCFDINNIKKATDIILFNSASLL